MEFGLKGWWGELASPRGLQVLGSSAGSALEVQIPIES
jgi:hypothetical protein